MPSILIIDESEAVRTALEIALSLHGHRVVAVSEPEDGLRAIAVHDPAVVILRSAHAGDKAPGETLTAFYRAIRASLRALAFIVLTDSGDYVIAELARDEAVEWVRTPWNNEQLLYAIELLIKRVASSRHETHEPSDAEIEQAVLRSRGGISRAARYLGISSDDLIQRMRRLRLIN